MSLADRTFDSDGNCVSLPGPRNFGRPPNSWDQKNDFIWSIQKFLKVGGPLKANGGGRSLILTISFTSAGFEQDFFSHILVQLSSRLHSHKALDALAALLTSGVDGSMWKLATTCPGHFLLDESIR